MIRYATLALLIASPAIADDWATEQRLQRLEEFQRQQEYDRATQYNRYQPPPTTFQDQLWLENYRANQRALEQPMPGPFENDWRRD